MAKKFQKNTKHSRDDLQTPFKAKPGKNLTLIAISQRSGCTYVYKVIPIVIYISALYKPVHNIMQIFTDRKCYLGLREK